ncbi:hypothetical protein MLD52_17770 [Puniceicoccaceae bacterium K14]|nr:hypothetical protein [Puniceicoccaceae bacterium K14]
MELEEQLDYLFKNTRSHASYFSIGDKDRKQREYSELHNFLEAYDSIPELRGILGGKDEILSVVTRGRSFALPDPPDIEIRRIDGSRAGLEISELVDERSISKSEKGEDPFVDWDQKKLVDLLDSRIERKDKKWSEDFEAKVLLFLCDEPFLGESEVRDLISDHSISITHFDSVIIFFSPNINAETGEYFILK